MARVTAVCVSKERRTRKEPVSEAWLQAGSGFQGDAHRDEPGRHVSLLSVMSLAVMEQRGVSTTPGCCGENLDVSAEMELHTLLQGVRLSLGGAAILETGSVGKDNSDGHADNVIEGNIFPEEGLFATVIEGGPVRAGDELGVLRLSGFTAGVLTISDSTAGGLREDGSGPALIDLLRSGGLQPARYSVVPDELPDIARVLRSWSGDGSIDVLFTVGGTGFSPRDVTPEATGSVCSRMVPGIPEMIRSRSASIVSSAWLSRGLAGICERTLVVNLPGSRKAALECGGFCLEVLDHGLSVLTGGVTRCGG